MNNLVLHAKFREKKEKNKEKIQMIPAVLYGKGIESKSLWINYQEFKKIHEQAGESTILEVALEGSDKNHKVLIYDVQYNPVTDGYRHLDFFQVKMDEEIKTEVELVFVGEPPVVKELGGVLIKSIDKIEVECLPAELPSEIKVDISNLKTFDDYIYVKDLPISNKVKVGLDPETVVALVSPPRSEAELESLDEKVEADIEQVEGIKKEKEEGKPGDEGEKKENGKIENKQ